MLDNNINDFLSSHIASSLDLTGSKNLEGLINNIKKFRSDILLPNQDIWQISNTPGKDTGIFYERVNGVTFKCLFISGLSNYLYVIFNGARNPSLDKSDRPLIPRWSYYKYLDGCLLGIDDPMFLEHPHLKLGWYYGNKDKFYLQDAILIIKKVCDLNNISYKNIIFLAQAAAAMRLLWHQQ